MLINRCLASLKSLNKLNKCKVQSLQITRNSSHQWNYRCPPSLPPRHLVLIAEAVQGFTWWWILWHLWTEPGHILGEFEYPDASKWTDEELGIPAS